MDTLLNPLSGEYVTNEQTHSLHNAAYIRLTTPLGTYWADPDLGSRLHLLEREKDLTRVRTLARQYSEQALQSLLNDKRASKIEVLTDADLENKRPKGWLILHISIWDAGNEKIYFKYPVRVI